MTDLWSLAAVTTGLPFMEVSEAWLSSLKHVLCYCVDFFFCYVLILTETWFILLSGSNPCELSCLAIGHNFYYNFGRVLDGTPCQSDQGTVCVNGKCLVSRWFLGHSFITANNHKMYTLTKNVQVLLLKKLFLPNLMTLKKDFCATYKKKEQVIIWIIQTYKSKYIIYFQIDKWLYFKMFYSCFKCNNKID